MRDSVEETLNSLLDAKADALCGAQRYERSADRVDARASSYEHQLHTKAGEVTLKVPKLRRQTFETAIIEQYKRREASIEEKIEEPLTYYSFPNNHWVRIRTNNTLERIMREIRRRTHVVGAFPDGNSALMLVAARLRHISGTKWGAKSYLSMEELCKQEITEQLRLPLKHVRTIVDFINCRHRDFQFFIDGLPLINSISW